ncbi:MAG: DNA polymerase III subunit gamma/tau [Trueperaceae bacterium]
MASIYQRARPRRFDQVVGQEHVLDVLASALKHDAVGHAYLFSGPRGVGKTTTARLLAMAVNCEADDPAERPCGTCESCVMVQTGRHPDVTELDAASNNSVDDVRDLREKVRLASLRGGRRVWVLDEAHMLSRAAANALLKTLEEPPPGLVFVLATTEPEKLPATVLSRCQHFRFRRLTDAQICGKLERLAAEAGVDADADALALVARAADGAMRDAESMLERLLVDGAKVRLADAEAALGLPPRERLEALGRAVLDGAWDALLDEAGALYRDGFAPRTVAEQLGRSLRDRLFAEVHAEARDADALPLLMRALDALDAMSERFVRQNDLYALEVALVRTAAAATGLVRSDAAEPDVVVHAAPGARSASAPSAPDQDAAPTPAASTPTAPTPGAPTPGAAAPDPAGAAPLEPAPIEPVPLEPAPFDPRPAARGARPAREAPGARPRFTWHAALSQAPTQLKAFLLPAAAELTDEHLTLRFDERHAFHHGQLRRREGEAIAVVDAHGGAHLTVVIEGPAGRSVHAPRGDHEDGGPPAKKA